MDIQSAGGGWGQNLAHRRRGKNAGDVQSDHRENDGGEMSRNHR
jgi:hypothetical protein